MTAAIATALVLLKVFLTAAEHAIRLSDADTLLALARRGNAGAERACFFADHPDHLWSTTRSLGRLALLAAAILLATALDSPWAAVAILTPVVLLTAELLPRGLRGARLERLAPRLATPLMALYHLFRPLIAAAELWGRLLGRPGEDERLTQPTREDLQRLVDQESGASDMAVGERAMIARIFEFSHLTAADSMIPLKEICAIDVEATVRDAVALIAREGYSRLPVYRGRMEEVVGVLHHSDLLRAREAAQPVGQLMRPPLFVPETQEIDDILVILQRRAASAAVVVDEFGKTVGLLTLEDILEEIVGEIDDEFDPSERLWRPAGAEGYYISARMTLEQFEQTFLVELELDEDEDVETLAGFMLSRLKKIPQVGESVALEGELSLVVHKANERAIEELLLKGPVRPREV